MQVRESIRIFACGENNGSHQCKHWWQELSAGQFLCYRFDPLLLHKKGHPRGVSFFMEQGTGIEPAFTAWEAVVLPIYEPCEQKHYTRPECKFQSLFVTRA